MPSNFWWIKHVLLIVIGIFFLLFGLQLLLASYGLNDPFLFIMTFFASNLMILISLTLIIGFVMRLIKTLRNSSDRDTVN